MSLEYIKQQHEARNRAWEEAKALLDSAAAENRELSADENTKYENISADLDRRAQIIETLKADADREVRAAEAMRGFEAQSQPVADKSVAKDEAEVIRSLARGDIRSYEFEKRDVTKSSTGSPVPTSFYNRIIELARFVGPMLETSTILNTAGGENLQIPSLSAYSATQGTATAEAAAFSEADPTFNEFVTLGAYKYGFLIQVTRELVEDAGVDILGFLADQIGNTMGTTANSRLTLGTGTIMPNGIVTRAGSGVASTATSLAADDLISLVYSLDTVARRLPGSGFMMNANTVSAVRKLKDNAGQYLFSPSLSSEDRDLLLGHRIYENPAMSNVGSAVKSVIFGNLSSYFVRQVGGIRVDRSDDFAFNQDLITFRASVRLDGNLIQTSHVKYLTTS
jgi:HK97 family phage major capsid protein